ncbi:MAG: TIGR02281 family clan AA aspartic protease [Hyphomicrobiaceae bacterium]|nr:TIGR02281 family clan AA aspartic protease [Hyphomicrobiaceae bacterium]
MALSTGTRSLLSEIAGWAVAGVIIAAGIAHLDTLKGFVRHVADLPAPLPETGQPAGQGPARGAVQPAARGLGVVELSADSYGHYSSDIEVNGRSITAMVDTGASIVALSHEDAVAAGIYVAERDYTHRVNTANGVARVAPIRLDRVRIGDIVVRDVQAAVSEPGRLSGTLLGMSFLSRLSRFEFRAGTLVLEE